jgi:hypothetical protein
MAQAGCARGALDLVMEQIAKEPEVAEQRRLAREKALPLREHLLPAVAEMYGYLLATVNNASELGTVANVEQQSLLRTQFLNRHDARLEQLLGEPLPASAQAWKDYRGAPRLVVLTARGLARKGEALTLPILALDQQPARAIVVRSRALGQGAWHNVQARHSARAVYRAGLPPATTDFEYYVEAETAGGQTLRWPPTAPELNHTVVVTEE